jgi:hypothetical protein
MRSISGARSLYDIKTITFTKAPGGTFEGISERHLQAFHSASWMEAMAMWP